MSESPFQLLKELLAFPEGNDQDMPAELTVQYLDVYVLMVNYCFFVAQHIQGGAKVVLQLFIWKII